MEEERTTTTTSAPASDNASTSSPTEHKHPLPSILKSSALFPPSSSRPGTPDTSSIHFSSGNHPEHVPVANSSSDGVDGQGHHSDPFRSIHPASRPSSLRRVSDDSLSILGSQGATPSPAPSPAALDDSAHPHGILKHKSQPNYGGNPGTGPALSKSRTSSSGGLSADIKPGYERRVGFDSMIDADETASGTFGFTLQVKSHGYQRTRNTRTFMCAVDRNSYSERALEWLMESLLEDNDEIVTVTVLEGDPDEIDQEQARDAARELMSAILTLNEEVRDRKISIVVEFLAGRVTSTIVRLIHMYRPDSLTIGTRGRTHNALQKLMGGAMIGGSSRDILLRSPVPVVVVRPEAKVAKHLRERQADPKRRSYHALVSKAEDSELPLTKPKARVAHSSSSSLSHLLHHGNDGTSSPSSNSSATRAKDDSGGVVSSLFSNHSRNQSTETKPTTTTT
ncbi:adenine nucleotide alpha hydrolases-like protein [Jaminaea rosea]|uniref:Adenine nucleotide alpha hydrolases-like protein n=1 Tax=Jaminaea rosea TaxID=1569628 RepID=A0A316UZ03_9BASI|nr:adenine nucleotide alpha hydrolases-like protein [Jaminaea rosea]PWN30530.1 adenine nucleotide alpha hydrolases-like protein [Jaminaea rosea]